MNADQTLRVANLLAQLNDIAQTYGDARLALRGLASGGIEVADVKHLASEKTWDESVVCVIECEDRMYRVRDVGVADG